MERFGPTLSHVAEPATKMQFQIAFGYSDQGSSSMARRLFGDGVIVLTLTLQSNA